MRLGTLWGLTWILGVSLGFAGESPKGRILFLDLNIASEEVRTLKGAAGSVGEVTVLPEIKDADRKRLNDLLRTVIPNLSKKKDACGDPACVKHVQAQLEPLQKEKSEIQARYKFTSKELDEQLSRLEKKGVHFDAMVISGHDGTGDMYGDIGVMPLSKLKAVMDRHPDFQRRIKTVGLWGCYTVAPPKVGENFSIWEPIFPEAELIMGFNPMSPRASAPNNLSTLKGAFEKRGQLIAASNKADFGARVRGISGAHPHFAAFQTDCDFYATPRTVGNIESMIKSLCKNSASHYRKFSKVFQCYYHAQECPDVPGNTGSSELRDTYNFLQDTEQCSEYLAELKPYRTSITKTIRLIFFKQVMANFAKYYSKQLHELPALLSATGAPAELKIPDLRDPATRRSEVLQFMTAFGRYVDGLPDNADSRKLAAIRKNMSVKLYELACVPFGWVEPDSIEEPDPTCGK